MYYSYRVCGFAFGKGKRCGRCNVHVHRAYRPFIELGQNAHSLESGTGMDSRRGEELHVGIAHRIETAGIRRKVGTN